MYISLLALRGRASASQVGDRGSIPCRVRPNLVRKQIVTASLPNARQQCNDLPSVSQYASAYGMQKKPRCSMAIV